MVRKASEPTTSHQPQLFPVVRIILKILFPLPILRCNNGAPQKRLFAVDLLSRVGQVMWIDKLAEGVLQVDTPIGPRFVRLHFKQRAYLLWMFRNFPSLPHQVLSAREQRMVDRAVEENGFSS